MSGPAFAPVAFADIPGWAEDAHEEALSAFRESAGAVLAHGPADLRSACEAALSMGDIASRDDARRFFERFFIPHACPATDPLGLLTGYYEPELPGSEHPVEGFRVPLLRRPPDLVNLVAEAERGAKDGVPTHARLSPDGTLEPYLTRRQIDEGGLDGMGLELLWIDDPVDVFFLHVQGSGLIRLPDGRGLRIIYDGKNGYPYTSVGRHLIEAGVFTAETMNLAALTGWLKADSARAREVLWRNESYVFFRVLGEEHDVRPLGTNGIPLRPLRSLAADTSYHPLGTPIFVACPGATHLPGAAPERGFNTLMVAHDVGSAIKGPQRGDVFCGSGPAAGEFAGMTKHPVRVFSLRPSGPATTE